MTAKKKQKQVDLDRVKEVLSENSVHNWLIEEGVRRIVDGKKIGANMEIYLTELGILK